MNVSTTGSLIMRIDRLLVSIRCKNEEKALTKLAKKAQRKTKNLFKVYRGIINFQRCGKGG